MANPFQQIRDERAAMERQRSDEKRQADMLEMQKVQAVRVAEEYCEQMVMQVLEQLREAVYPSNYCVMKSKSPPGSWQIGCEQWLAGGEGQQTSNWEPVAGVSLEYNRQKQSVFFRCWRRGREARVSGLSQAELIATLRLLYAF